MERGRPGQLSDRDHPRHLGYKTIRPKTANEHWSKRSSTPPAKKAPASGPVISALADLGMPDHADRRGRFRTLPLRTEGRTRCRSQGARRPEVRHSHGDREVHRRHPEALYASKIISYAQGFMLLRAAAAEYGWNLDFGAIALMWRGGCIIRSHSSAKSRRRSTSANACQTCCSTCISSARFASPSAAGATSSPQQPRKLGIPTAPTPSAANDGQSAAGPTTTTHRPGARRVFPHQLDRPRGNDIRLIHERPRPTPRFPAGT